MALEQETTPKTGASIQKIQIGEYVHPIDAVTVGGAKPVTTISASSTDDEIPSAKCMYDIIGDVETLLSNI